MGEKEQELVRVSDIEAAKKNIAVRFDGSMGEVNSEQAMVHYIGTALERLKQLQTPTPNEVFKVLQQITKEFENSDTPYLGTLDDFHLSLSGLVLAELSADAGLDLEEQVAAKIPEGAKNPKAAKFKALYSVVAEVLKHLKNQQESVSQDTTLEDLGFSEKDLSAELNAPDQDINKPEQHTEDELVRLSEYLELLPKQEAKRFAIEALDFGHPTVREYKQFMLEADLKASDSELVPEETRRAQFESSWNNVYRYVDIEELLNSGAIDKAEITHEILLKYFKEKNKI